MKKKKKFKVTVVRTVQQTLVVEVDAETPRTALAEALLLAPDLDFSGSEKEASYDASTWEETNKTAGQTS